MNRMKPLAGWLGLPPGWVATRFPSTIELELKSVSGFETIHRTGMPVPYDAMNEAEWKAAAAKAIEPFLKP